MRKHVTLLLVIISILGCSQSHDDLEDFIAKVKAKPVGQIDPIPTFTPYKPFDYSVSQMRSPFDRPIIIEQILTIASVSSVKPDLNRNKEFLEQFTIESLSMVGTIEQKGNRWALIDDGKGGVHYVKAGNYLGINHGKINQVADNHLQLVEIVSNGNNGWIERPITMELIQ